MSGGAIAPSDLGGDAANATEDDESEWETCSSGTDDAEDGASCGLYCTVRFSRCLRDEARTHISVACSVDADMRNALPLHHTPCTTHHTFHTKAKTRRTR